MRWLAVTASTLCWDDDDFGNDGVRDQNGNPIVLGGRKYVGGHPVEQLGSIDRTSQTANSWGGIAQGVDKTRHRWDAEPVPARRKL